jgi:(p)ppGpp synthase/HD superfamily hydrolase
MEKIQSVINFAVKCHMGQARKASGLPYIVHPMAVLSKLGEWHISDHKCWIAAICHDIREDCPNVTREQLVKVVGKEAASIVDELTFIPLNNGVDHSVQKAEYMKSFKDKSIEAVVVKVADRMCNTLDYIYSNPQYARKYWNKAEDLLSVMLHRAGEIDHAFGAGTFIRIRYSQTLINERS